MVDISGKAENVKNVFNSIAADYVGYFGDDWEFLNEIKEFSFMFKPNSTIIDLGCGSGYITHFFKDRDFNAIGIDFSSEMINIAKEKFPDTDFRVYDFLKISDYFDNNSVDGVIAIYSLYFVPRDGFSNFLQSLSNIMKDGGKFLFVTQVGNGERYVMTPLMEECNLNEKMYVNCYSKEDLEHLLEENNFVVDYFKYIKVMDEKEATDEGRYLVLATNKK